MNKNDRAFDRDAALEMVDGNQEVLAELAHVFLEHYGQLARALDEAVQKGDMQALAGAAHDVKGAVSFFGPTRASQSAVELERTALASHPEAALHLQATLHDDLEELASCLRQLVANRSEARGD
jgi:HPt (histidine-containing phosphotransfer) domain-containing protein